MLAPRPRQSLAIVEDRFGQPRTPLSRTSHKFGRKVTEGPRNVTIVPSKAIKRPATEPDNPTDFDKT